MPPLPSRPDLSVARFDLAGPSTAAVATVTSVSGLAVPWDVPAERFGVPVVFTRDTLTVPDDLSTVKLLIGHDDDRPAGYATAATVADDGLHMTFAVDESHPRAAELMREVALKWRDGLSVGVELDADTADAMWAAMWEGTADPIPLGGVVREVSAVTVPQFNQARIGAGAALARFHQEGTPTMPPTLAPPDPAPAADPAGPFTFSPAELAAELAPFLGVQTAAHPLARFASLGEFMLAAREGHLSDDERLAFALADQVTTDNPGVVPPAWLSTIVGILDRARVVINAFGGPSSAGDSGMTLNWPYYDGGYDGLVGEQVTEKTEVTTRKVSIKNASADLATYAGASDISYQLLRRSSPSYREAYSRILSIAYAVTTDAAFSAAVAAAATPDGSWPLTGDLAALLPVLFDASSTVDDAVGVPADVVLAAPDVFAAIGVLTGLVPAQYGTQNVSGTSDAATLRVNVSGLAVTKAKSLPAGTLLVGSSQAASWAEDGPFAVEGDDVAKLGVDVGIWGMGTSRITVPGGIVSVDTAAVGPPPPPASDTESSSRRSRA
jgi:hypothetical protein